VFALLAGCAGWTTDPKLILQVDSRLDRPVLIYVNGDWIGTLPAGATDATVPAGAHGGPPWTAEGRTAAGRVLVSLEIPAPPSLGEGLSATALTACGTITMSVGDPDPGPPPLPPEPTADLPPCD
jgi:hypothetical protein